jgi:hypothetical protein
VATTTSAAMLGSMSELTAQQTAIGLE